jgi:glutathione gamma-glutamylcysteinyltransferase
MACCESVSQKPVQIKGPWRWIDEEMLDCCSPLEVIAQKGVTMAEFSCLASCNGAECVTKYAEKHSEEEFLADLKETSTKTSGVVLVVSYDRSSLGQVKDAQQKKKANNFA